MSNLKGQDRRCLQTSGALDVTLRLLKDSDGTVLLPILPSHLSLLDLPSLRSSVASGGTCEIVWTQSPLQSKKEQGMKGGSKLANSSRSCWTLMVKMDRGAKERPPSQLSETWRPTMEHRGKGVGAKRLAKMSRISRDGFRSPVVTMLLGEHSWVKHVDNGIGYEFDVTKCMFSAGNITEKLRVAGFDCRGETVVDLYAGIGYFTLPYLVHAGASHVHACEWNPDAVEALQKNLEANGVSDRCTIHQGDNQQLKLHDIADRVNLGLIPSSEDSWPVACAC
ncbi:hypothetical protein INR49_013467 [Caranx melampygus]|nr:hypothetical protein INR49_013467 [Caranx melampygus]